MHPGVPYVLLTKERYERVKAKWHDFAKKVSPGKIGIWSIMYCGTLRSAARRQVSSQYIS